jgi:uncharacterized protein
MSSEASPTLDRVFHAILRWRWAIVVAFALLCVPCAWLAMTVGQDNSVDRIIAEDDPQFRATKEFEKVFGGGEYAVLILEAEDAFSQPVLERAVALEKEVAAIAHVQTKSVLAIYREARAGFEPTAEGAAELKKFVNGTEIFKKQGLCGDKFLILGMVMDVTTRAERDVILAEVEDAVAKVGAGPPLTAVRRVGKPYVNHYFDEAQERSGPRYFGLFMVFVVGLVMWLFRSWRTLVAFLATLGVSVAILMGFVGLRHGTFTLVSPMVPMTILITATATCVYLHSRYAQRPEGVDLLEHHVFSLSNKFLACTASVFAATVGFAALYVSEIRPIRDMGVWVAVGLVGTWVVSFTLFPALQRILKTPTQLEQKAAAPWFERFARAIPEFSYKWRWPLVIGSLVLSAAGVVSVFGAGKYLPAMQPLTEPLEYVQRSSPVYQDAARAKQLLPGTSLTQVWLKGKGAGVSVSDPKTLDGLAAFEAALAADKEVGAAIGLPGFLRLARYIGEGTDAWPTDEEDIEGLAELLEGIVTRAPEATRQFVNRSLTDTEVTVLSHAGDFESFARLEGRIRAHWDESVAKHAVLGKDFELQIVGMGPLQAKMSRALVPTLTESFGLTAGIIFLTFLVVFRSGAARIMTMLPSLFAILVMFLAMRVTGMTLNIATILIASTVLGTSENDQIHFFYHFLEGRKTGSVAHALTHTLLISGRAIFFATIINAGGFLAFTIADLRPFWQFGSLTALALVLSMIADFTALPAALWLIFREKPDAKGAEKTEADAVTSEEVEAPSRAE